MPPNKSIRNPHSAIPQPKLRVGFLLIPRFTLLAFAGFIDSLRLAADDGDRSRPLLCTWEILGDTSTPVVSSSGVSVRPTGPLEGPCEFDFIVVVGGLLHGGQQVTKEQARMVKKSSPPFPVECWISSPRPSVGSRSTWSTQSKHPALNRG